MILKSVEITNLRKIEDKVFRFNKGLNALIGQNAVGKTTVLEAIFLLISGKSFRAQRLQDLISRGQEGFQIIIHFQKQEIDHSLSYTFYKGEKSIKFNNHPTANLYGLVLGVLLTPDDQHLIKGSPHVRRDFLDLCLSETDPLYSWHLSRYSRALKQRNALLKLKELKTIESWEHEMSRSAAYLTEQRSILVEELKPLLKERYSAVGEGSEEVSMAFDAPKIPDLSAFYANEYARLRSKEIIYGHTLVGPHKDDLKLLLNGEEAKHFASEGQKQTLLVALKLAEWERIRRVSSEEPLFMIDDFGMGMDKQRKERLIQLISNMNQSIITSVDSINSNYGIILPLN